MLGVMAYAMVKRLTLSGCCCTISWNLCLPSTPSLVHTLSQCVIVVNTLIAVATHVASADGATTRSKLANTL